MDTAEFLLCSECFQDEGLRLDAQRIGVANENRCQNCGSHVGAKLTKKHIEKITYRFFVLGTMHRTKYGAAPILQFNYSARNESISARWSGEDLALIQKTIDAHIFHYGPRLWMIGHISPLEALQSPDSREGVINRIIDEYPEFIVETDRVFYRLRKSPANPAVDTEYDSPPEGVVSHGRIDSSSLPVMYASPDVEVCIHECRVTAEDDLYLATLQPIYPLRLLNLAGILPESDVTEFDSLDLSVYMLFLAGSHSYDISRELARAAYSRGYDGLLYPSYFSVLRTGTLPFETSNGISHRVAAAWFKLDAMARAEEHKIVPNIAIFGRPIKDKKVSVKCVNRMVLRRVSYDVYFGPAGYS